MISNYYQKSDTQRKYDGLYKNRNLSQGYPAFKRAVPEAYSEIQGDEIDSTKIDKIFLYLDGLIGFRKHQNFLVLGCGPEPRTALHLTAEGYSVVAVEPVHLFTKAAGKFLGENVKVLVGAAESIPVADQSQDVVVFKSVLEHIDSVPKALAEIYIFLSPRGVLFLTASNRSKISTRGNNGEFNVPFYNWFRDLVKEGYVHPD